MNLKKTKIGAYLLGVGILWAFCFFTLKVWLMPYSSAYAATGQMTLGYFAYAAIGLLFSTPAPFLTVFVLAVAVDKMPPKTFFLRIFQTEKPIQTAWLTVAFCLLPLIYALVWGTPNGEPWFLLPLGFLIMIPFVGIAEEVGWRGFLQPKLNEKMRFPFSVLTVAGIWFVWHLDLWLDETSRHYNDSLPGFAMTVLIWSFALAALYKATNSVFACAVYHAWIDAIGAVYDWNLLFDAFPGNLATNVFRFIWLSSSIAVWIAADRKQSRKA